MRLTILPVSKRFSVTKMESLYEFLSDPSPFGLRSFNLSLCRGLDGGSTLCPVQN